MSLTPVQQKAYDSVQSQLHEGFLGDVNEDNLNSVKDTLKGLNAADADAVIDEMAKNGQLQRLADESNDSEFLGMGQDGYSPDQMRDLFNDLAGKLDGDSLAKVHNAWAQAEDGDTEFDRVTMLADSIASHGSPQAKLDYINAIKANSTDGKGLTHAPLGGDVNTRMVDGEAAAIGKVLGSMRGANAEAAFRALSPDQLKAVLKTGIDETDTYAPATIASTFDTKGYENVMKAAASMGDADLKAHIINAGAESLRTVRDADDYPALSLNDDALKGMTKAIAGVIDSDTTGVVRELAYNSDTRDGSAMATYAQEMIETGQTEKLADQMAKLQFGNGMNENALTRLDEVTTLPNGQQRRENAGALGYFVGSVYAGAKAHSGDVQKQQEVVKGFLGFLVDKIPVKGPIGPKDGMLGQDLIGQAVKAAINDPGMAPAQRLELAALPQQNGEVAVGDDINSAFEDTLSTVQRLANP